jgi:polyphosphate kinase
MQLNALVDPPMVTALYRASRAGVQVDLVIRGNCGLRPGIPDVSDHIEVRSILGRFLEHARILQFGTEDVFIGSADLMPRNLDRRVEALVPVEDPALRAELCGILDIMLADNTMAWRLGAGGSWLRLRPQPNEPECSAQEQFMEQARVATAPETTPV